MTESATNTFLSLLCSGVWTWNPDQECTIEFREDGTGDLVCRTELTPFIASEFDWEMRPKTNEENTALAIPFHIAMTLTKRELKENPAPIKHTALGEAAFEQKIYSLVLDKGDFKVEHRTSYGSNPTYEYRLLWDKSPYPPLEEWNHKRPAAANRYWERKDFYTGRKNNG